MNYIDNANDFVQLICNYEEVILFPRGTEGHVTLEFLQYTNLTGRICCLAAGRVDNVDNTLQKFDHFLPVIPFEYLLHFRESAILVVATPPQIHDITDQSLARIGFKNVVFLSPTAIQQIQAHTQNMYGSGQVMLWFMNHITKEISEIKYRIDEQNEVCTVNTKAFAEYRNCFRGRKIVIFASGPTSKYYKPIPDAIHIGVNFSWRREDIPLDYLFAIDGRIVSNGKIEEGFNRISERIFVGTYIPSQAERTFPENILLKKNVRPFHICLGGNHCINKDICHCNVVNLGTVASAAIQFALFTYPKEIYLVGCDTTHEKHFYDKPEQENDNKLSIKAVKTGYARLKMFAKHYYPGTEIISINPVGLKGLFRDVYTEDYLASLVKEK